MSVFGKLLKMNGIIFLILTLLFFFKSGNKINAVFIAVLISASSVQLSAWVLGRFWEAEWNQFNKIFLLSLFGRFFLVVVVLIIILVATKIDEIYFTVSFIISYLCNSVTKMIFINKILQKSSTPKL